MLSFLGSGSASTSGVLTLGSGSVSRGTLKEGLLGGLNILSLALPSGKDRLLEGTTVGEGQGPWAFDLTDLVHGIQVEGGLFLRLSTGQEADTGEGGDN